MSTTYPIRVVRFWNGTTYDIDNDGIVIIDGDTSAETDFNWPNTVELIRGNLTHASGTAPQWRSHRYVAVGTLYSDSDGVGAIAPYAAVTSSNASPITNNAQLFVDTFDFNPSAPMPDVTIWAIKGSGDVDLIYVDGAYTPGYAAASTTGPVFGVTGLTFQVGKVSGWDDASITLKVKNVSQVLGAGLVEASKAFTVSNPSGGGGGGGGGGGVAPVVSNVTPATGTQIARTDFIEFDVTDADSAIRAIVLMASWSDASPTEVIWDGDGFGPNYSLYSIRTAITNGYHFKVRRTQGWPSAAVTFKPVAIDVTGLENT